MTNQEFEQAHDRAFVVASNCSPATVAAIQAAITQGNKEFLARLTCGMAASPSIEELEAELGREFVEQICGVKKISSANDRTTSGALDEVDPESTPFDSISFL